MVFWRKRSEPAGPTGGGKGAAEPVREQGSSGSGRRAHSGGGGMGTDTDPSSILLSGDPRQDQKSVRLLLDAIARVSESRDLESLLDFMVDRSVESTGA